MKQYPVFIMCGRDPERRRLMKHLDPDGEYKVKALLPFLGRRVIDWQLDALRASTYVDGLYLLGLGPEDAAFEYPIEYVPIDTLADFPDKLVAGIDYLEQTGRAAEMIVISSSDSPAVTPSSVNRFFEALEQCPGHDLVVSLVPESLAENAFPRSGRAVARFRDQQVFPGELFALSTQAIRRGQEIIRELHHRRRRLNRQVQYVSLVPMLAYIARRPKAWPAIFKFLLRRATLEDGERALSLAFDAKVTSVIIPDAGFGMDMDLPEDYARLQAYVADRAGRSDVVQLGGTGSLV